MNQFLKQLLPSLIIGSMFSMATTELVEAKLEDSPKTLVDEVWQIVDYEYVDQNFNQVDWLKVREELLDREYSSQTEAYEAIREALKKLGDPYTRFLSPKQFEELTNQTAGELSGIGVRIEIDATSQELVVVEPLTDSPAAEAGIQAGDRIIKINGKPTAVMGVEQALEEIRGEAGTTVELELSRPGNQVFEVSVTRAQVEVPSVSYQVKQEGNMLVGYIKLDEFSSHAAEQMKKAVKKLQNDQVTGFVLDLRNNPGGLLYASVDIARMWLEEGVIVKIINRPDNCEEIEDNCGQEEFSANGTALSDLPLVILVNQNSASASEVLAAALKENNRATVVGTRTFGKGTVQSVHNLSDGSGLAVTISRYYPPSGTTINKRGITPDIYVELNPQQELLINQNPAALGTNADPQYTQAIAYLKSNHSNYTTITNELPDLPPVNTK